MAEYLLPYVAALTIATELSPPSIVLTALIVLAVIKFLATRATAWEPTVPKAVALGSAARATRAR